MNEPAHLLAARPGTRAARRSINGLIYVRGQPHDYDTLGAGRQSRLGLGDVLPYFKQAPSTTREATSAPTAAMVRSWCSDMRRSTSLWTRSSGAAEELGVPRNDDFNGGDQEGVGYYQLFTRNGWRSSAAARLSRPGADRGRTSRSRPTRTRPA